MDLRKDAIIKISDELLLHLLRYRLEHRDFTFSLRTRDSSRSQDVRLEKGQWFQGGVNYICVPLFKVDDTDSKVKTVGFILEFDPQGNITKNCLQIAFRGITDPTEIEFHKALMAATGAGNVELEETVAQWSYSDPQNYINNLDHFLDNIRPRALTLLRQFNLTDKYLISERAFNSNLGKIEKIRDRLRGTPNDHSKPTSPMQLNTILYGPPGTGKTYSSILRAAKIVRNGESFEGNYDGAKAVFKKSFGDQIEFVTFHQNYSYEDFVVGLRPDVDGAGNGLRFVTHKGIFYNICQRAKTNYEQHNSGQTFVEPSFEEVLDKFLEPLEIGDEIELKTIARNVNFNITANNGKNLSFRKQNGGTDHTLSISTMKAMFEDKRDDKIHSLGIYIRPVVERLKEMAKEMRSETGKVPLKNYVLVIDEINRANISKVFGELITLLEPDKRIGEVHELELRLPGLANNEKFSVPPNLYIVGTMNTADKSIALIDIALRRRFVFEAMYPQPELAKPPYNEFLRSLNTNILREKNADFLIGHSYLMTDDKRELDFESALNHHIIPLLNEYFYNNRGVSVFSLLQSAISNVPGFTLKQDPHTGVVCQKA
jgi:hypothetical protein